MQIRIIVTNEDDSNQDNELLSSLLSLENPDFENANPPRLKIQWSRPKRHRGIWKELIEWIGTVDVSAFSQDIVTGLISTHLWEIFSKYYKNRTKQDVPLEKGQSKKDSIDAAATVKAFPKVTVVVIERTRRVEFDPSTIDKDSLQAILDSLFQNENSKNE